MTIGKLMFIGGAETQTVSASQNSEKYRFELLEELFSELRVEKIEVITTPSEEFEKMRKNTVRCSTKLPAADLILLFWAMTNLKNIATVWKMPTLFFSREGIRKKC